MQTKVLIGVDPHKATNALAVLDEHGELLERRQFPADRKGLEALERWARASLALRSSRRPIPSE
jgi:hypothetical protein